MLSDFPIPCDSYNLFFYQVRGSIRVKIFPRYTASPLYMGYRITQVVDSDSRKYILSIHFIHPGTSGNKDISMKLYAFSDFHLSGDPPSKPMDIFGGNWKGHREKIRAAWLAAIRPEDTVILAGDLSWGGSLAEALPDLMWIAALPGRKIVVRGNHDYWWDTVGRHAGLDPGNVPQFHGKRRDDPAPRGRPSPAGHRAGGKAGRPPHHLRAPLSAV